MRRFLAILLIALLPVQAAWALAGAVCTPQTMAAVNGHGHHEHHAHDATSGQAAADEQTPCQDSPDHCVNCHGGCCGPLGLQPAVTFTTHGDVMQTATPHAPPSPALARPERPKWLGLA